MDITQIEPAAPTIVTAAANLGRARRHAVWLERLAISILTFGAVFAVLATIVAPPVVWLAFAGFLAAAATWGVLRALALVLHLKVDAVMVELDDDSQTEAATGAGAEPAHLG
jgi:hypothetical protein